MWAVIALKSPVRAKSRLAGALGPGERRRVFFSLAARAIVALRDSGCVKQIAAVTSSEEVSRFVSRLGVSVIRQPHERGTAQAFAAAVEYLAPRHLPRLLMMAADLPLIDAEAVRELVRAAGEGPGIVVAPDRHRRGTNALLCAPPDAIAPCFGEESFRRHLQAAASAGVHACIFERPELAIDLDVSEDLRYLHCVADSDTSALAQLGVSGSARRAALIEA